MNAKQPSMKLIGAMMLAGVVLLALSLGLIDTRRKPARTVAKPGIDVSKRFGGLEAPSSGSLLPALEIEELDLPEGALDRSSGRKAEAKNASRANSGENFDCVIEPSSSIDIGSAETGVLGELLFDRSDFVLEGQVVARLESGVELAAVDLARMRAEMDSEVQSAAVNAGLGKRRIERAEKLYDKEVLSLDVRDGMETDAELAEISLKEAEEQKRLAAVQLRKSKADLERRTIKSPVSGIVVQRFKEVGEVVKEEAILSVAQVDPLHVEVVLPAALFGAVKRGMRAEVMPEPPADGVYIASVEIVDGVIDPASGTFGAQLVLPNPDRVVPSGLHCQVNFIRED